MNLTHLAYRNLKRTDDQYWIALLTHHGSKACDMRYKPERQKPELRVYRKQYEAASLFYSRMCQK